MTRLFAVIALGTLLLVAPARAQVEDDWVDGWADVWWSSLCNWVPELCE
jgi:hypothetical protein